MSIAAMTAVWRHSSQRLGARLVHLALADVADDFGRAWPSVATLAAKSCLSKRQVQRSLEALIASGEIEIIGTAGDLKNSTDLPIAAAIPREVRVYQLHLSIDSSVGQNGQKKRSNTTTPLIRQSATPTNCQGDKFDENCVENVTQPVIKPITNAAGGSPDLLSGASKGWNDGRITVDSDLPSKRYFLRGKEVLGNSAGGLLRKLLDAKGMRLPEASAAVELAAGAENPREYVGGIIRKAADKANPAPAGPDDFN